MLMPRICPANFSASAGVLASLMPPALPRFPVGTCAFTTHGPICAAALAASFALMHRMPRGTGMAAGASTSALAAFSSKFMGTLLAVFRPVGAEQFLFARLVFRDRGDEVGDVEEVFIVEVVRDRVAAPGAAAHAQREVQAVIKAATIAKGVRLVDQHAHHVRAFGERTRPLHVLGVQADRMAAALECEHRIGAVDGIVEIPGAVDRKHQRELLSGKREALADTGLLDHEELLGFGCRG